MTQTDNQNHEFLERMQRIETLVGQIQQLPDPNVRANVQELVQTLLDLHRSALEKVLAQVREHEHQTPQPNTSHQPFNGHPHFQARGGQEIDSQDGRLTTRINGTTVGSAPGVEEANANGQFAHLMQSPPSLLDVCARDKLVSSVLLLHDLHPWDLRTRVQYALDQTVRPYLRSEGGDAGLQSVEEPIETEAAGDDSQATVRIHVDEGKNAGDQHNAGGGGCGCGSSGPDDLKDAIQNAIRDWAPDLGEIQIVGITQTPKTQPGLIQLTIDHGSP